MMRMMTVCRELKRKAEGEMLRSLHSRKAYCRDLRLFEISTHCVQRVEAKGGRGNGGGAGGTEHRGVSLIRNSTPP